MLPIRAWPLQEREHVGVGHLAALVAGRIVLLASTIIGLGGLLWVWANKQAVPHANAALVALCAMLLVSGSATIVASRASAHWIHVWVAEFAREPPRGVARAIQTAWLVQLAAILPILAAFIYECIDSALPRLITLTSHVLGYASIIAGRWIAVTIEGPRRRHALHVAALLRKGRDPCFTCAYDLGFTGSPRCPECGARVEEGKRSEAHSIIDSS